MTVLDQVKAAISGSMFTQAVEKMDLLTKILSFAALKTLNEVQIAERLADLRNSLLADAEKLGEVTEKGSFELKVGGHKVLKERRESTSPDPDGIRTLLRAKNIPLSKAFTEKTVTTLELDINKLEHLVATGHLDKGDVDKLRKLSWALKVTPSSEVKALLERVTPKEAAAEQPSKKKSILRVVTAAKPHRRRSRKDI